MAEALQSTRHDVADMSAAVDFYFDKGWTDGLPVVPPTENAIWGMLESAGLEPQAEITFIDNRQVSVTAEKVAINGVMAGCRPEYMPVLVAAVEAMGDPLWSYHGPATSTGGSAVLTVVNGPIAEELGLNHGDNLFGPGWRPNASIGRALRLVMRNVIGTLPGRLDRSTLGHSGKYGFCIAENEAESPWPALHVERGFRADQSTSSPFWRPWRRTSSTTSSAIPPRASSPPPARTCASRRGSGAIRSTPWCSPANTRR